MLASYIDVALVTKTNIIHKLLIWKKSSEIQQLKHQDMRKRICHSSLVPPWVDD